jgi:hypothetical protein
MTNKTRNAVIMQMVYNFLLMLHLIEDFKLTGCYDVSKYFICPSIVYGVFMFDRYIIWFIFVTMHCLLVHQNQI